MSDSDNLAIRRKPVQARSRERVDSILTHATHIINDNGVDATSMSAIARSSSMSLASLYRYFPNKSSIIRAIAEQHVEKLEQVLREQLSEDGPVEIINTVLDIYYQFYRDEPAYKAIWSGVEAMPELQALDLRELYSNAEDIDRFLARQYPQLGETERRSASLMLPRTCGSMLRLAVTMPDDEAVLLVDELKRMVRAYLFSLVNEKGSGSLS
ncbi:TetR family transcriptional regulator [Marinobacter sp. V034]|uniref:TetR family transcriptional regulator n=1 Tax=Marinobacter sp. V034 TaxID=3459610 RepID=UPI0040446453